MKLLKVHEEPTEGINLGHLCLVGFWVFVLLIDDGA